MDIEDFKNSLDQLPQNMQEVVTILASSSTAINISQISETLSALTNEILNLVTDNNLKNLTTVVETIAAQLSIIVESPWTNIPVDSIVSIPVETIESIQSTITHLDEGQQTTCQEFIQSHAQEFQKRKMTLPDALALLTLLVTIFFGILQLLPDQQLEKIIEQNDTRIAQNEVIIQNQTELESVLYDLGNGIHLLTDVVDSIRDGNEDIDDFSKIQSHTDSDDTKQQNTD